MQQNDEKVFLETSVQYKRLFGLEEETSEINEKILDRVIYCSTFVRQEFRNLFIVPLLQLYFLVYNSKDNYKPKQTLRELKTLYSFKPRRLQTSYDIVVEIASSEGGFPKNRAKALAKVEKLVREAEYRFINIIDRAYLLQGTGCIAGEVELENTGSPHLELVNFYEAITQDDDNIHLTLFVGKRHKPKFEEICDADLSEFESTKYNYNKRKEFKENLTPLYEKIAKGKKVDSKDYINKLADTVIAIESPRTATLLTYDQIFSILSVLFEKDCYVFPSIKINTVEKKASPS